MITVIVCSTGENRTLGQHFIGNFEERRLPCRLVDLVAFDLPLYTASRESEGIPSQVQGLKEQMLESDAFVFVAPEYNGGVPPVFVNAISWVSRTGDDWRLAFSGKAAALATHSGGGGTYVLSVMRQQLSYLGMNVVGRHILTTTKKPLTEASMDAVIDQLASISSLEDEKGRIC